MNAIIGVFGMTLAGAPAAAASAAGLEILVTRDACRWLAIGCGQSGQGPLYTTFFVIISTAPLPARINHHLK